MVTRIREGTSWAALEVAQLADARIRTMRDLMHSLKAAGQKHG